MAVTEDGPLAIGLVARRGWTARLAAMAVISSARSKGYGSGLIAHIIDLLTSHGCRDMMLEVIEQNARAVHLYEKSGFDTIRRLVSFNHNGLNYNEIIGRERSRRNDDPAVQRHVLEEVDIATVANQLTSDPLANLPWQLSGPSLMVAGPPDRAYRLDQSFIVISDPSQSRLSVRAIFVKPAHRRQGCATKLVAAIMAAHPDRQWSIPALCPEELSPIFARNGFQAGKLSQLQMKLQL